MGAIPPTAAGAALSVSAMQGDLDGNAVYVVGVDFTAGAEDAQTDLAASSADAEGSSDQTAASLGAILAAGLSDDNRLGPLSGRRDRKSTRLNSSHLKLTRMPSSA